MNANARPLQGLWPFIRKELAEWWRGRGALATMIVLLALGTLGTLATRIDELGGGTPTLAQLDPTYNILGAKFEQWIVFASLFASIGMLIGERSTGTLAWTLSKPISRSTVLLAKWAVGTLMLTVFGLVIPLTVTIGIAFVAYGAVPDTVTIATLGLWLAAAPAFIVALNLALATRVQSQAAIGAISFAVVLAPYLLQAFLPTLAELWPTSMANMAITVAAGQEPNLPTIAAWATTLVVVGTGGLLVFSREDM